MYIFFCIFFHLWKNCIPWLLQYPSDISIVVIRAFHISYLLCKPTALRQSNSIFYSRFHTKSLTYWFFMRLSCEHSSYNTSIESSRPSLVSRDFPSPLLPPPTLRPCSSWFSLHTLSNTGVLGTESDMAYKSTWSNLSKKRKGYIFQWIFP